jgi:hypothetical protein
VIVSFGVVLFIKSFSGVYKILYFMNDPVQVLIDIKGKMISDCFGEIITVL